MVFCDWLLFPQELVSLEYSDPVESGWLVVNNFNLWVEYYAFDAKAYKGKDGFILRNFKEFVLGGDMFLLAEEGARLEGLAARLELSQMCRRGLVILSNFLHAHFDIWLVLKRELDGVFWWSAYQVSQSEKSRASWHSLMHNLINISKPLYVWHDLKQLMRVEEGVDEGAVVVGVVQDQEKDVWNQLLQVVKVSQVVNVFSDVRVHWYFSRKFLADGRAPIWHFNAFIGQYLLNKALDNWIIIYTPHEQDTKVLDFS